MSFLRANKQTYGTTRRRRRVRITGAGVVLRSPPSLRGLSTAPAPARLSTGVPPECPVPPTAEVPQSMASLHVIRGLLLRPLHYACCMLSCASCMLSVACCMSSVARCMSSAVRCTLCVSLVVECPHVVYCTLHAVCIVLHVVHCCMLAVAWRMSPACYLLHAACCLFCVACCPLHGACRLHVVCCTPFPPAHVGWMFSVARCVSSVAFSPVAGCMPSNACCTFCGGALHVASCVSPAALLSVGSCLLHVLRRMLHVARAPSCCLMPAPVPQCRMRCAVCRPSHVASRLLHAA